MKIGIIAALDREYDELRRLLGGKDWGSIAGNGIVLAHSGMGKVNAALKAAELINGYQLDALVNSGVAGGLAPELKTLDVLAATEVVYHDVWCGEGNAYGQIQGLPERFKCDSHLLEAARAVPGIKTGLFTSGDFFISTKEEGDAILSHFPEALCVDMESGAIAQVCAINRLPFLSLRVISDVAGSDHQAEYDNFWATLADGSFTAVEAFLNAIN